MIAPPGAVAQDLQLAAIKVIVLLIRGSPLHERTTPAYRDTIAFSTLAITAIGLWCAAASAAEWQTPGSIRQAAADYVEQALAGQTNVSVEVRGVDDRVRLPICTSPLQAHAERALRNGQGLVSVECSGESKWRLFVPVRAIHNVAVVIATDNLMSGNRISRDDISLESRASTSLPLEYLTRIEDVVGLTIKRSLPAGTILVPAALDRHKSVRRGELVTLVAGAGGIMVKSEGIAIDSAALNERVRVKTQAGRVVEGVVEAQNLVRVGS